MKKCVLIFSILVLTVNVGFAHRLNEYLQATTISLSRNQVRLELRLTPGTDVAAKLLKSIDLNGDQTISTAEQKAYLAAVNRDLSLKIDWKVVQLNQTAFKFSSVDDLRKGVGDIAITYITPLDSIQASHQLILTNSHYSNIAVYLVNCLLPADIAIHVTGQTRSADQSVYQLNFTHGHISAIDRQSLDEGTHWAALKTYFIHGVKHILTGYDHLLFLCALVLGATGLWDLIKIVTAFTIAHSITLALATFGLAHLPEQIVEPMIAASIVFVAVQNIAWPKHSNGNSRLAVAFFFGLFHGLGFAGGLLEVMHAMSPAMIWYAILGFSLGVEAGNQLVLLPLYGGMKWLKRKKPPSVAIARRYASAIVALAGLYYLGDDLYHLLSS